MSLARFKKLLGTPFFEAPGCLIYQGDCMEYLKKLPVGSIHLTVTSPPYNIGKEYEKALPLEEYLTWSGQWIQHLYTATAHNGSFWLNLGYLSIPDKAKAIPIPYLLWDKIPFYLIQEVIWHYKAGVAGRLFFSPRNEKFLWYVKNKDDYIFNLDDVRDPDVKYPNQKKNGKIKVNPKGKNPGDVWHFPKVTSGHQRSSIERTPHPAQFPKAVIDRIIKASSHKGQIVLDPFIGSGTTAEVAVNLDREVIGFELRQDYCEIIAKRLETAINRKQQPVQKKLFQG